MIVYIVIHEYDYEGDDIYGVFSTLEKAQQVKDELNKTSEVSRHNRYIVKPFEMDT